MSSITRAFDRPILVRVSCGGFPESLHRVDAVVVDGEGRRIASWGNPDRAVVARSTLKPFAALALIETPAASWVRPDWIALASGSHDGTPFHLKRLKSWMMALGCQEQDLLCGPRAPLDGGAASALIRNRKKPTRLHNDRSGEHLGLLTLASAINVPLANYILPGHPVQERVRACIAEFVDMPVSALKPLRDDCGAPTFALPLTKLADAAARLIGAASGRTPERPAARRIVDACRGYCIAYEGDGRLDTMAMAALRHHDGALVKSGAEGILIGAWAPRRSTERFGLALKVEDGARRARDAAAAALLLKMGTAAPDLWLLRGLAHQRILDSQGVETGRLTVDFGE